MRIAYIDPYPVPDYRVASIQILQNIDAIARNGDDVFMVTPVSSMQANTILGRDIAPGVHFSFLKDIRKKWYFPFNSQKIFCIQISHWLKKNPVDVILTRNLKMANFLLSHHPQIPCFFESHEIFAQSFKESHNLSKQKNQKKYKALLQMESKVYNQASAIFVKTTPMKDDIIEQYKTSAPIVVIPNGADLHAIESFYEPQYQQKENIQLLYLGSLHRWKGVPTIIEAIKNVDNITLNIAGGKAIEIEQLKVFADSLGVLDKIRFLGYIEPVKRFELIAQNDICVLSLAKTNMGSRYTSPLKLFEYMALGKPVVISDFPSIRDVVDDRVVSFAQSEDVNSFSLAIKQLVEDGELRRNKGLKGRELVLKYYNWQQCAKWQIEAIQKYLP